MEQPVVVRSPHLHLSPPQHALIEQLTGKLERHYPRLVGCAVSVDPPPGSHRSGGPYEVRIDVKVPGQDLHVSGSHDTTLEGALRDAFQAASRRLEDFAQQQRRETKRHEPGPREIQP